MEKITSRNRVDLTIFDPRWASGQLKFSRMGSSRGSGSHACETRRDDEIAEKISDSLKKHAEDRQFPGTILRASWTGMFSGGRREVIVFQFVDVQEKIAPIQGKAWRDGNNNSIKPSQYITHFQSSISQALFDNG